MKYNTLLGVHLITFALLFGCCILVLIADYENKDVNSPKFINTKKDFLTATVWCFFWEIWLIRYAARYFYNLWKNMPDA